MIIKLILVLFHFLMMPLNSLACEPLKKALPCVVSEIAVNDNGIPQEYLIGFPQPAPDNQPRDLVVPVRPNILDILEDDHDRDEQRRLNRPGPMPFFCGLLYSSMVAIGIILLIKNLTGS